MNNQTLLLTHEQLNELNDAAACQCDVLFAELGVNLWKAGKVYIGKCPIHDGDNDTALNFYPEGNSVNGYWRCNTKHCEQKYVKNAIGFTRAILESQQQQKVPFPKVIEFLQKLFNHNPNLKHKRRGPTDEIFKHKEEHRNDVITRENIRQRLKIPADYFVQRGFSPKILDEYDVGLPLAKNKEMSNRAIVPIYNKQREYVGCTARALTDTNPVKWRNSESNIRDYLYGLWYAYPFIKKRKTVIVVEGSPNIWKLREAGINIGVALLGNSMTDSQQCALEACGATTLICCTDSDDGGEVGYNRIIENCHRMFNIIRVKPTAKDFGDMKVEDLKNLLKEYIDD